MYIREIISQDVEVYKQLRLEMVQRYPTVFNVNLSGLQDRPDTFWQQDIKRFITGDKQKRFLAFDQDYPVGIIGCIVCCETLEIGSLYVRPPYQNNGIGRNLMTRVLDFAASTMCETAGLWVSDVIPKTKDWYRRLGFTSLQPPEIVQHEIFPEIYEEYLVLELKKWHNSENE